jgi:predicted esterase
MSTIFAVTLAVLLRDFPCPGCIVEIPDGTDAPAAPAALIVALHGDEGNPAKVAGVWAPVARKVGFVLFAPRCPKNEGCPGSWWRWDGSPRWLTNQVAEIGQRVSIDPRRRYLTGWSGGASYLSLHIPELVETFAAFSLAGGGIADQSMPCAPGAGGACAPIHLLSGELNPHAALAARTRGYLEKCGHDIELLTLQATDHAGEWRRYARDAEPIARWLLSHPMGCAPPSPTHAPAPPTPAPDPAGAAPARPVGVPSGPPPTRARGCACGAPAAETSGSALGWLVSFLIAYPSAWVRLRRRRSRATRGGRMLRG